MKAPFIIFENATRAPQATGRELYLAGFGLRRLPVYKNFPKTAMALTWKYTPCMYLGSMLQSTWDTTIGEFKTTWRQA